MKGSSNSCEICDDMHFECIIFLEASEKLMSNKNFAEIFMTSRIIKIPQNINFMSEAFQSEKIKFWDIFDCSFQTTKSFLCRSSSAGSLTKTQSGDSNSDFLVKFLWLHLNEKLFLGFKIVLTAFYVHNKRNTEKFSSRWWVVEKKNFKKSQWKVQIVSFKVKIFSTIDQKSFCCANFHLELSQIALNELPLLLSRDSCFILACQTIVEASGNPISVIYWRIFLVCEAKISIFRKFIPRKSSKLFPLNLKSISKSD